MLLLKSPVFSCRRISLFSCVWSNSKRLQPTTRLNYCRMSGITWAISLICPEDNHGPIKLPHKEPVFIGRSPETRIVDPRCSRKQVKLTADLQRGDVQVVQLGTNSSALDGIEMIQDKVYSMKPNSTLYVLTGFYPQKLKIKNLEEKREKKISKSETGSLVKSERNKGSSSSSSSHSSSGKKDSKSGSKRPSSGDLNEPASKMPRLSVNEENKNRDSRTSSSKKEYKSGSKRPSSGDLNESAHKMPKLSVNGENKKRDSLTRSNSENDDENVKGIKAKLDLLKSSAKGIKTPAKPSSSSVFITPSSSSSGSKTVKPQAGSSSSSSCGKPAPESRWDQHDSLFIYTSKGLESRRKLAAFDIDGTIITTQSGKVFPTHPGDWRLLYHTEIGKKMKKLHADGYKIVFITNQMGVSKGKTQMADLKVKFGDVLEEIGVPVQILVSTKTGIFRKPCIGMWNYLCEKCNDGIAIELSQSFYVGDAAGRAKDWAPKKKKDFSCSDRLFALNIGLDFRTPEEFFLGYPTTKFTMPEFDPRKVSSKTPLLEPYSAKLIAGTTEMILNVGFPASGKSFLVKEYLEPKGYVHVNRDTLGTWQKCAALCKDSLRKGKSVVVDNTNPDVESRARFIKIAESEGVACRCFLFTATKEQARHNERFREITDKSHHAISDMIMNTYKGKYRQPEIKEGFTEIVKVNFVPKFKDANLEELYRMFLLDK